VLTVFYTNNDVDAFLSSGLIRENFDIEEDSTKVHHPREENAGAQYQAIHFTVRLSEGRIGLAEYARFKGLRCEIQIQTILNHAWSETSHDILYKSDVGGGYGEKAREAIARRFERIMNEYLIPAGYEIQKAQQEYERLRKGKELFDQDVVRVLDSAQNNNERHEILTALKDHAIPNYDDLPSAYEGLRPALLRAFQVARRTPITPIETLFGKYDGFKAESVVRLIVEIVDSLRYADPVGTLTLLMEIYKEETDDRIRTQIVNSVKHLAEFKIDVYNKVGVGLQMALLDHLGSMDHAALEGVQELVLAVWTEALQADITGVTWSADSMVLRTGALPESEAVRAVRDKAMASLFAAYDRSGSDVQRKAILIALDAATRTPLRGQYSNALLAMTKRDADRIVQFAIERIPGTSYEILQHLEHKFHLDYLQANQLADDPENRFACQPEARSLRASILKFRDAVNTNQDFIRYKILVGFESVYPGHWDDEGFDFHAADTYRRAEVARYLSEINEGTEAEWFRVIERCAQTQSNDLATFPLFGEFLSQLAAQKPEIAERLLGNASDNLRRFLAAFLNGLFLSGRRDLYERVLEVELRIGKRLSSIAFHIRLSNESQPGLSTTLLKRAIEEADRLAVVECLYIVVVNPEKVSDMDGYVRDAFVFLNEQHETRWTQEAWLFKGPARFYENLSTERVAQILENLSYLPKVDFRAEEILTLLAEGHREAIWDFFGARLDRKSANDDLVGPYEAIPFRFHSLQEPLSKDAALAIRKGMAWFADGDALFEFGGGRLISNAFPDCTPELALALTDLVKNGDANAASFALAILKNYHGEISTHSVLKEIVNRFHDDRAKMSQVRASFDSTGVVSGEFGFVEAWRRKKELLSEWLTDERDEVRKFAEKHIAELDLRIAADQRLAEAERAMYVRDFGSDADSEEPSSRDTSA
jgi:hypothetical protein